MSCISDLVTDFGVYIEDVPSQRCIESIRNSIQGVKFNGQYANLSKEQAVDLWHHRAQIHSSLKSAVDAEADQESDASHESRASPADSRKKKKGTESHLSAVMYVRA